MSASQCFAAANPPDCSAPPDAEPVTLAHVVDGDTIILRDQRHLRLIGLNTPELGHRAGTPDEPLAREARAALAAYLEQAERLSIAYGQERFDRHGRTLGHLFLRGETNVQALLIARGLAFAIAVSPNLAFVDCYAAAEMWANKARLGIWRQAYFKPRKAAEVSSKDLGFRRISGRTQKITRTRHSVWLKLGSRISLRIDQRDLMQFPAGFLNDLHSKTVVARGWLSGKQDFRMRVYHPLDLEFHLRSE